MSVVGLCYWTTTIQFHFLNNKYSNKPMDENLLQLAVEQRPMRILPYSQLVRLK
jgi:hypothetical protein